MTTPEDNHKARVAGGAGYALAARLGAGIEAISFIAFTWFYGAATFGLFAVLWSYVKVTSSITELAMTPALQRFIPQAPKEREGHIAGFAIKLSFYLSLVIALAVTFSAPKLAPFINAAEQDKAHLVSIIQIYVWVLPFWCLVNVATAAVRATRTFGPEVKVRIFYEQGLRFLSASIFAGLGFLTYGLFWAHLISMILSALLAFRLLNRHYDLKQVFAAPLFCSTNREIWQFGLSVMPAYLVRMLFSEFPVMFLNMLLPGAAGAAAGGYYSVARKVASVLQAIHKTFEYVMAPLASEKKGKGDKTALAEMYAYATRLSICVALPFAAAIILARQDLLSLMRPEFQAAKAAIAVLCVGRIFEAAAGPSSAIVEMLGHKLLPTINGLIGLSVLVGLGFVLIPEHGVTGAAIAAALGINTTAYIALIQNRLLFELSPYCRELLRPLAVGIITALLVSALVPISSSWPMPVGLLVAIAVLLLSIAGLIRFGLSETDAEPFGKLARIIKRQ